MYTTINNIIETSDTKLVLSKLNTILMIKNVTR